MSPHASRKVASATSESSFRHERIGCRNVSIIESSNASCPPERAETFAMTSSDRSAIGLPQLTNHLAWIKVQGLRDIQKLNNIQTPLPSFVLTDKRLQTIQTVSKRSLRDARSLPGVQKNLEQLDVTRTVS